MPPTRRKGWKPDVRLHDSWGNRLYRGELSYDFIGKQKRWYTISGALLLISVLSLGIFGLNFSQDFRGGAQFDVKSATLTTDEAKTAVGDIVKDPTVQTQTTLGERHIVVKTTPLSIENQVKVRAAWPRTPRWTPTR